MNTKFKVGNKVTRRTGSGTNMRFYEGDIGILVAINGEYGDVKLSDGYVSAGHSLKNLELIKKGKTKKEVPPKFLLQYEIHGDPFEEFQTIAEIKKRIKELVPKGGHKFVVWEIKKKIVLDVQKVESVSIKGI